jgi:drug/metabolite transporter (DMT)-like permease
MSINLVIDEGSEWLLLGIMFTALPHSLMAAEIRNLSAKLVATIACLQPVISAFFAFLLLDELASGMVILGK